MTKYPALFAGVSCPPMPRVVYILLAVGEIGLLMIWAEPMAIDDGIGGTTVEMGVPMTGDPMII